MRVMPEIAKSNNFEIYYADRQNTDSKIQVKKTFFGMILLNFYTLSI